MSKNPKPLYDVVPPEPSALIESLRSFGYTLPAAVADIVDNSIAAGARNIRVNFLWAGTRSSVYIIDDGVGMSENELRAAMRPGSRNPLETREPGDLGRFGLGLKTASLSQCRNLCVVSKPSKGTTSTRTWDLEALAGSSEWRLLLAPSLAASEIVKEMESIPHGTAVVWSVLDRLVGDHLTGDAVAHGHFNSAIDLVREHLGITFHRFIEERLVKIYLNDRVVVPWNPFMRDGAHPSSATPEEVIPQGKSEIRVQGFILPHKDTLTEKEYLENAGPRGWTGQQGFYIYRNKRLLVFGDWLQLGRPTRWTREEHYKLARIRLDILNDADEEWHLDVKKSFARPPALIRDRLTDLAEKVRETARSVFAHRGKYGRRRAVPLETERPWLSIVRENRRVYAINRRHPVIRAAIESLPSKAKEIETLLRVLEETVPVEQIWLDTAEQAQDHAAPYAGVEFSVIKTDMRRMLEFLVKGGINRSTALEKLKSIEPFDRYQGLLNEL